jgi:carboxyl-terminal processing protease
LGSLNNYKMTLTVRSILVVVLGTVLGVTVAIGSHWLGAYERPSRASSEDEASAEYIANVIARVRREYVDPISDEVLIESAIRGIVQELDAHSRYLDAGAYEEIRISTTGLYSGVGLDVSLRDGRVTVISPIDGAPADRAGILPGDIVIAVDDIAVDQENIDRTVSRMRGESGTKVTIDVLRDGTGEPIRYALTRSNIQVKTVSAELIGDGYGYIRLSAFSDTTVPDLDHAAAALLDASATPLRGVVLDLRSNPGGVLEAAIDVADRFIEEGLIVRGTGRISRARFERHAEAGDILEKVPLVVLVNRGSASASEIVAGAIKDHDRGRLIGERTYGKGSVQTILPLDEQSAIKLTTSRYILPSGRSINGRGIEPHVTVRNDDPMRFYRGASYPVSLEEDRQLRYALRSIGYNPVEVSNAE